MKNKLPLLITILVLCSASAFGKTEGKPEHSPKRAGMYSALVPGWGQGYNKKYWKIPIVWAGLGATGYFIYANAVPMSQAKKAYLWIDEGSIGEAPNDFALQYPSTSKLESLYDQYRYNMELFAIVSLAWYGLNIIDAVVDAHLKDFDISEDLSISLSPTVEFINRPFPAAKLTISF